MSAFGPTNQSILEKAIQKAIDGGWKFFEDCTLLPVKDWVIPNSVTVYNSYLKDKAYLPQQVIIFNHDFAQALWGEEQIEVPAGFEELPDLVPAWQYHLQQMVIADDPIAYLGEHLPQ